MIKVTFVGSGSAASFAESAAEQGGEGLAEGHPWASADRDMQVAFFTQSAGEPPTYIFFAFQLNERMTVQVKDLQGN